MGFYTCFCSSWKKKKESKGEIGFLIRPENDKNAVDIKLEHLQKSLETNELKPSSLSVPLPSEISVSSRCNVKITNQDSPLAADSREVEVSGSSRCNVNLTNQDSLLAVDSREVSYVGGDEKEITSHMTRNGSGFDWQTRVCNFDDRTPVNHLLDTEVGYANYAIRNDGIEEASEFLATGHTSDPGVEKAEILGTPTLKRSCSDLVMRSSCQELKDQLPIGKSNSYENMLRLADRFREGVLEGDAMSPVSVMTHKSADRVILKKHSSSQILPSGSRKLWWKLFLWSHRNLYRTGIAKAHEVAFSPVINLHGGYSSDTIEPRQGLESRKIEFPSSVNDEAANEEVCKMSDQRWDEFYGASGMWPQNQWIAFPTESSPFARVDEWVKKTSTEPTFEVADYDHSNDGCVIPPSPDNALSPASRLGRHPSISVRADISHANSVIQSLNASSTVAHMTGIQLRVIPAISHFSSLRSVNLSGNSIAHITPGSLPKGLHVLNLSKNKINIIEGLRDLTRLRVIDLSYNCISQIGQGLSNCTVVKELYLAGNKVSVVEGLHRLLKLSVLDLSFNKITTTKSIGQLVANYSSLIALNLLGNPIQRNVSDDQLQKTVCSLLPKLALLNKQPINMQKAREISSDVIAKVSLGSSSSRNKGRKQASSHRRRQRSKGHAHSRPSFKDKP